MKAADVMTATVVLTRPDASVREAQRAAFQDIRSLMQNGAPEAPRLDPVDRIAALLD